MKLINIRCFKIFNKFFSNIYSKNLTINDFYIIDKIVAHFVEVLFFVLKYSIKVENIKRAQSHAEHDFSINFEDLALRRQKKENELQVIVERVVRKLTSFVK